VPEHVDPAAWGGPCQEGARPMQAKGQQMSQLPHREARNQSPVDHPFDGLAKALAIASTRREALRHFGGLIGTFLLATLGLKTPAWAASNNCTAYCRVFAKGPSRNACLQKCGSCSNKGRAVCLTSSTPAVATCCPKKQKCCGTECCPKKNDCCAGLCCPKDQTCCDDGQQFTCVDLSSNLEHCGDCGVACEDWQYCNNGVCESVCDYQLCVRSGSPPYECCAANEVCPAGVCEPCPPGNTMCVGFQGTSSDCCAPGESCCHGTDGSAVCCAPNETCRNGYCGPVDCLPPQVRCGADCCEPEPVEYCIGSVCVAGCSSGLDPCFARDGSGYFECCTPDQFCYGDGTCRGCPQYTSLCRHSTTGAKCCVYNAGNPYNGYVGLCCPDAPVFPGVCPGWNATAYHICCGATPCDSRYHVCVGGACVPP